MIPARWYLNSDTNPIDLLQQNSPVPVCSTIQSKDNPTLEKSISLDQLSLIRNDSANARLSVKPAKVIYAELFGISRKAIEYAIKADMQDELSDLFKTFIYNIQCKINNQEIENENLSDINNPTITKHKGRPPKRLKANVEQSLYKGKRVLKDSTQVNVMDTKVLDEVKGRKCGKCKEYGHYAKTCRSI